jgi:hypothetical protein
VPVSVAGGVIGDAALAVDAAGNDRNGSGVAQGAAQPVGVVALVGNDIAGAPGLAEKLRSRLDVGDVAGRQREREGAAQDVGERMDLGGLAAARGADGLRARPPLWMARPLLRPIRCKLAVDVMREGVDQCRLQYSESILARTAAASLG